MAIFIYRLKLVDKDWQKSIIKKIAISKGSKKEKVFSPFIQTLPTPEFSQLNKKHQCRLMNFTEVVDATELKY